MDLSNIKFRSLTDQVYEYLSSCIIEGKVKGGEKLIEKNLCQEFGISRSPLRECFRILESEGLLIITPRKGAYVPHLTKKDIEDAFPVRATLERLAAKLALQNLTENDIANLKELIMKMEEAIIKRDIRSFYLLNDDFHNVYVKASGNQVLEKTLENLGKGTWLRISFIYFQSPSRFDVSNKKHKQIVEAFIKKDPAVETLVEEHMEETHNLLISSLD